MRSTEARKFVPESKEPERSRAEASIDTLVSPKHPDRNEDAALGDAGRLQQEMKEPPKLATQDVAMDDAAVRDALARETKAAGALKDKEVFGVLDGISGGEKGTGLGLVASRLVSARVSERMAAMPDGLDVDATKKYVLETMRAANADIKAYKEKAAASGGDERKAELKQMGTTLEMMKLVRKPDSKMEMVIGHAGDGRVYKRDAKTGKLEAVTVDENLVGLATRMGGISKEDYKRIMDAPDIDALVKERPDLAKITVYGQSFDVRKARSTMFNAISGEAQLTEGPNGNVTSVEANPGDQFLLTTDGIHDELSLEEMQAILDKGGSMKDIVKAARDKGLKDDDATGSLVEVPGEAEIELSDEDIIEEGEEISDADIEEISDEEAARIQGRERKNSEIVKRDQAKFQEAKNGLKDAYAAADQQQKKTAPTPPPPAKRKGGGFLSGLFRRE